MNLQAALIVGICASVATVTVGTEQRGGAPPRQWWVAKATPGQYGTNKPHIKLADLKAKHKGQPRWMEVVVNDENFHAEYHQAPPGVKLSTVMHPDTREFYAVLEGQMRFTLEGQTEPIVASRGSVVNIPKRTAYAGEVIGNQPALWVAANQQHFKNLYPVAEPAPAATPGVTVMKVGLDRKSVV